MAFSSVKKNRTRTRAWLHRIGVVIIALWAGGFFWFSTSLTRLPLDTEQTTDGIVVLTGGAGRLQAAVDLLNANKAKRLLISGVNANTRMTDLTPLVHDPGGFFACCVDLGKSALNTKGNAEETAAWAQRHEFYSLRVVTTTYHIPRSMLELHFAMPDRILLAHPVFSPTGQSVPAPAVRRYWLLAQEFTKYLFALIQARTFRPG